MDYTNERKKRNVEDSIKYVRQHFGTAVIIGGIFSSLFFIPYAGIIIAPVTGVVAATIAVDYIDLANKKEEELPPLPHVNGA